MPKRSIEWNEGLSRDLKDKEFAKEFIKACIEDGMDMKQILRKVILTYGLKEFATKAKLSSPLVSRAISSKHNPTMVTLNRLLIPLGLQLSVVSIGKRKKTA